jgi:hypothetical protein
MSASRCTSMSGLRASNASTARCSGDPSRAGAPSSHAVKGPRTLSRSPALRPMSAAVDETAVRPSTVVANSRAWPSSRPKALMRASADPVRSRVVRPCSKSRTTPILTPAVRASCRWVSPAAIRYARIRFRADPDHERFTVGWSEDGPPHRRGGDVGHRKRPPGRMATDSIPSVFRQSQVAVPSCACALCACCAGRAVPDRHPAAR